MLAGKLAPDDGKTEVPQLHISYKPQKISPKSEGTVRMLLHEKIRDAYVHPQFVTDVMKPLRIDDIMDQEVQNLSGGKHCQNYSKFPMEPYPYRTLTCFWPPPMPFLAALHQGRLLESGRNQQ